MAEDTGQSRVIPATPRRRVEALKQGQIAFSPDLAGSLLLLVGVGALYYLGPGIGRQFLDHLRGDLMTPEHASLGASSAGELLRLCYSRFLLFLGMFLGILVVSGIGVSILQVGFHITPERLAVNFERLSPARNVERLFSVAALV
jgi:flagellar biosynthetic protein FlhB